MAEVQCVFSYIQGQSCNEVHVKFELALWCMFIFRYIIVCYVILQRVGNMSELQQPSSFSVTGLQPGVKYSVIISGYNTEGQQIQIINKQQVTSKALFNVW